VLALRVGGEKGDDEADTVGCCSLRVEHMAFEPNSKSIILDFLGKDSMRYFETIDFTDYGAVGALVYDNFKSFCKKKSPTSDVFDQLTPATLNSHLSSLMPGLSAKVFRTYNASITLQKKLPRNLDHATPGAEQIRLYNTANREVSILCNHQRSVPKGFDATFGKMQGKLKLLQAQSKQLKAILKRVKAGEDCPIKKPADDMSVEQKREQNHLWSKQPSEAQVTKRILDWKRKVETCRLQVQDKEENKAVSLTTAKINYMDPRITVAWCKQNEVQIEKVFAATLRSKFPWAMGVKSDWEF
jgi:DNA topoisomerase-1